MLSGHHHGIDECSCDCHRHPGVKHCMPCCHTCPACQRHIAAWAWPAHAERCPARKTGADAPASAIFDATDKTDGIDP